MYAFDISRPATIAEAVSALSDDEAQPLSGGQTLIPTLKQRLAAPSQLVSLGAIPELQGICMSDGALSIGAATPHVQVAGQVDYPALARLAGGIGDPAVRNRGTIGGSVANNDPAACYPAGVLASGAVIVTDKREIAADDYFQGLFSTALDEGEIIIALRFPVPARAGYAKFEQPASRFALCGAFVAQAADGSVRVAITGASQEGVFRWHAAEEALRADFTPGVLDGLVLQADDMLSDLHGSGQYRAHLAQVMTRRAVQQALA
jgi:carbon-monoxide dehydrogenase medium subunit